MKSLGAGLWEFRIDTGPGFRIYLTMEGTEIVILFGGGTKKGQQADIIRAKELLKEYKSRKAVERKAKRLERSQGKNKKKGKQ